MGNTSFTLMKSSFWPMRTTKRQIHPFSHHFPIGSLRSSTLVYPPPLAVVPWQWFRLLVANITMGRKFHKGLQRNHPTMVLTTHPFAMGGHLISRPYSSLDLHERRRCDEKEKAIIARNLLQLLTDNIPRMWVFIFEDSSPCDSLLEGCTPTKDEPIFPERRDILSGKVSKCGGNTSVTRLFTRPGNLTDCIDPPRTIHAIEGAFAITVDFLYHRYVCFTVSRKHMMKTDLVSRYSSGGLRTIFTDKINAQSVRELNLSVYDRQFKALEGFIKGLRMSVKNPGSRRFKTRAIQRLEPHAGRHRFSRYGEKEISVTSSEGNSRSPSVHFFWCGAP